VLFDAKTAKISPKIIATEDQQEPNESRRLWSKLTGALRVNNQDLATLEKCKVEDAQRASTKEREERGLPHIPRYFESDGRGNFDIRLKK
jgi:hypothetical protein